MSIRLRLTLLYSAILALTLIAFSGILYTIQSRYTLTIVRNDLVMSANRIVPLLISGERGLDRTRPFPWMNRGLELKELRTRDTVRLLDADGVPLRHARQRGNRRPATQRGRDQATAEQPTADRDRS